MINNINFIVYLLIRIPSAAISITTLDETTGQQLPSIEIIRFANLFFFNFDLEVRFLPIH
jgi:hypothetical protein